MIKSIGSLVAPRVGFKKFYGYANAGLITLLWLNAYQKIFLRSVSCIRKFGFMILFFLFYIPRFGVFKLKY